MAGKPMPALFELIRSGTALGATALRSGESGDSRPGERPPPGAHLHPERSAILPKPVVRVRPEPMPPAQPTDAPDAPGSLLHRLDPHHRIALSVGTLYLALALLVPLSLIVYGVGHQRGQAAGDAKARRDFGFDQQPSVNDPLRTEIPVNPGLLQPPSATAQAPPQNRQARPSAPAQVGDPRQPGNNYLRLASYLDRETAARAVAFLDASGLPAFAVAQEKSPGRYILFARPAIPSGEYRARAAERQEIEGLVRRLGTIWKREHRGQTDFADAGWERFGP